MYAPVVPGLYSGNDRAAADAALLQLLGVRYIVNAASECPNYLCYDPQFTYLHVALLDCPDECVLASEVEAACAFIDHALDRKEGVLVHCLAGRSRSATIVLAYLVTRRGLTLYEAYQFLQARRPSISPNLGFMGFLMQLEPHISAHARPSDMMW